MGIVLIEGFHNSLAVRSASAQATLCPSGIRDTQEIKHCTACCDAVTVAGEIFRDIRVIVQSINACLNLGRYARIIHGFPFWILECQTFTIDKLRVCGGVIAASPDSTKAPAYRSRTTTLARLAGARTRQSRSL
jgi:hypothetical protein